MDGNGVDDRFQGVLRSSKHATAKKKNIKSVGANPCVFCSPSKMQGFKTVAVAAGVVVVVVNGEEAR